MKRHCVTCLLAVLFCLSLISCTSTQPAEHTPTTTKLSEKDTIFTQEEVNNISRVTLDFQKEGTLVFEDVPSDFSDPSFPSMLYWDGDFILREIWKENYDETADITVFYDEMQTGELVEILTIKNFKQGPGCVAERNGKIYYPVTVVEDGAYNDVLFEIDKQSFETRRIDLETASTPIGSLLSTEKGLLRIYSFWENEETTYNFIDFIDIDNQAKITNIIKTKYTYKQDTGYSKGESILATVLEGDRLYTHIKKSEGLYNDTYLIREYNISGKIQNEYDLDLNGFLDMSLELNTEMNTTEQENMMYENIDVALWLTKKNNFFVLSTINHRQAIFELQDKHMKRVRTPEILRNTEIATTFVMASPDPIDHRIYFWPAPMKPLQKFPPDELYVFDSRTGIFSHVFDLKTPKGIPYSGFVKNQGDLILQERMDTAEDIDATHDNITTYNYYCISKEKINKLLDE